MGHWTCPYCRCWKSSRETTALTAEWTAASACPVAPVHWSNCSGRLPLNWSVCFAPPGFATYLSLSLIPLPAAARTCRPRRNRPKETDHEHESTRDDQSGSL